MKIWADAFRAGKLKLKQGFHTKSVTFHDSCNFIRVGGYFDDTRILLRHICADFREMSPNGILGVCCSNGGGHVQMPEYKKKYRLPSTKAKAEQIKATGAHVCVVMCHNCEDGVKDGLKEWGVDCEVVLMSEFVAEAVDLEQYAE